MEYLRIYIVNNLFLNVIAAVMLFIAIYNFRQHQKTSVCIIAISAVAVLLSFADWLQSICKDYNNIMGATIFSFIGYVIRPLTLIWFIFLSGGEPKTKWGKVLFSIPFTVNLIVFIFCFVPGAKEHIFCFFLNEEGKITFFGGKLRYISHIISMIFILCFNNENKIKA